MISFSSDYIEGCAPEILARFAETNLVQQTGYGADIWCESAKARIREAVGKPEAEVFFICGGTQTNMITIDAMLKSFEGVVSVTSGHINGELNGQGQYVKASDRYIGIGFFEYLAVQQHGEVRFSVDSTSAAVAGRNSTVFTLNTDFSATELSHKINGGADNSAPKAFKLLKIVEEQETA